MFKKIMNIVSTLVMIVVVIIAGIFFVPRVFGITPMAVLSGSMEPTYHVGSLVFVGKTTPAEIKVGDPITFKLGSSSTVVTHRVIEIDTENKEFKTKGDNNNSADGDGIPYSNVIGKAKSFSIPIAGYLAVFMDSKAGIIALVTIILAVIILSYLPDLLSKSNDKKKVKTDGND